MKEKKSNKIQIHFKTELLAGEDLPEFLRKLEANIQDSFYSHKLPFFVTYASITGNGIKSYHGKKLINRKKLINGR